MINLEKEVFDTCFPFKGIIFISAGEDVFYIMYRKNQNKTNNDTSLFIY